MTGRIGRIRTRRRVHAHCVTELCVNPENGECVSRMSVITYGTNITAKLQLAIIYVNTTAISTKCNAILTLLGLLILVVDVSLPKNIEIHIKFPVSLPWYLVTINLHRESKSEPR